MTLASTALRLAAIEALRPAASTKPHGPWPTIAKWRVYDAKLDNIDDLATDNRAPVVIVYTDDEKAVSYANDGRPFRRTASLGIEMSIPQIVQDPDNQGHFYAEAPETDAETEASLDLLAASIEFALFLGPTGRIFRILTSKVSGISYQNGGTSEEAARLAFRSMTIDVELPDLCFSLAPTAPLTGLDRLPEPLRSVIAALPDQSYGRAIGTALADFAPTAPIPVRPFTIAGAMDAHVPAAGDEDVQFIATPPQE